MNTVTVKLLRTDFERLENALGIIANLAGRPLDEAGTDELRTMLFQIETVMPPAEARRLVDELDRQRAAQEVVS